MGADPGNIVSGHSLFVKATNPDSIRKKGG
jgi:hypothetical protein